MPSQFTISAVAIGEADAAAVNHINNSNNLGAVRPYITGLVDEMCNKLGYTLTDNAGAKTFSIDYWEKTEATLQTAAAQAGVFTGNVIFAMSSTVVRAAQGYNQTLVQRAAAPIPIVGIVSNPAQEGFYNDGNICGFSAQRHQTAAKALRNFVASFATPLTTVVALHKQGYNPSSEALRRITDEAATPPRINLVLLPVSGPGNIRSALNSLPVQPPNTGILVLPADMFFAYGDDIINWVQNTGIGSSRQVLPTFFFAPDWVRPSVAGRIIRSAFGAYGVAQGTYSVGGVAQSTCGAKMADKVDVVLSQGVPKNPVNRWTAATDPPDFIWVVNTTVANSMGLAWNQTAPPNGPATVA
jgi:hypothetical protein